MTDAAPFDPLRVLALLVDADVRFVLIGGVATRLHGSPSVTRDVDICYDRDAENLQRLSALLRSVNARLRGVDQDLPFILDEETLAAGSNFTFVTDIGDIDVLAQPSGIESFEALFDAADTVDLGGFEIRLASLDDLVRMKQAAHRPKDMKEVEILLAIRDEVEDDE